MSARRRQRRGRSQKELKFFGYVKRAQQGFLRSRHINLIDMRLDHDNGTFCGNIKLRFRDGYEAAFPFSKNEELEVIIKPTTRRR